jgi:hypothetical protein
MSATDDVVATRKLTETETSTLRALLKSQLNITGDAQDDEDAGDLLDYAFAMIANGKAVSYVTEEVRKSLSFLAITFRLLYHRAYCLLTTLFVTYFVS